MDQGIDLFLLERLWMLAQQIVKLPKLAAGLGLIVLFGRPSQVIVLADKGRLAEDRVHAVHPLLGVGDVFADDVGHLLQQEVLEEFAFPGLKQLFMVFYLGAQARQQFIGGSTLRV